MRFQILPACVLALVTGYAASPQGPGSTVTGIVRHDSVARFPTVVYIEEMAGRTFSPPAEKQRVEVRKKEFSPRVLPVLVGTTVEFISSDGRKHTIASPDGEKYDLGQLKPGEMLTHTFESPGSYLQACFHHPDAIGYVLVVGTPFFTLADEKGAFRIENVPAGKWRLKVWNEGLGSGQLARTYDIDVDPAKPVSVDIAPASIRTVGEFWAEPAPAPRANNVLRGEWLFRQKGCFLCHGPAGIGGVRNRNYINGTVPALKPLAEKLKLSEPEDIAAVVDQLERGRDLERFVDDPLFERYEVFFSKYRDTRNLILNGNPAGKLNSKRSEPPLVMPSWKKKLSSGDIDALMAYLLSLSLSGKEQ